MSNHVAPCSNSIGPGGYQNGRTKPARPTPRTIAAMIQRKAALMRLLRFRDWLDEMVKEATPDAIYFEEIIGFPRKNMGRDAAIYHGFSSHMAAYCETVNLPYQGAPVVKIKKHITGKGNASKQDVILEVKRLGYSVTDDNQADAIALLQFVEQEVVR